MASTTTRKTKKPQRTIALELHQQWRKLERKNDCIELAKLLKVSKPTIDKALIYGAVHQQQLIDGINTYFADRLIKEKEEADHLKGLASQGQPSTQNS